MQMDNSTTTSTPTIPSAPSTTPLNAASGSAPGASFPGGSGSSPSRFTFSARTCLELLPKMSPTQVNNEVQFLDSINPDWCTNKPPRTLEAKRDALRDYLTNNLFADMDNTVNNYLTLVNSFSCTVKSAEEAIVDITKGALDLLDGARKQQLTSQPPLSPLTQPPHSHTAAQDGHGKPDLDQAVSLCQCDLSDINIQDMLGDLTFDTEHPGGRKTTYFGQVPYNYGRFSHPAATYPSSEHFDKIFAQLQLIDADITPSNYTCLCTLYPDGGACIPLHSDNERSIEPGSTIYTVSFGAPRDLRLSNTVGPLKEHFVTLKHGSVYAMSQESQDTWRHGIDRDPTVHTPRLSLTFRKLLAQTKPLPKPPAVPPVAPPPSSHLTSSQPYSRQSRVLLIHDSIIQDAPERVFEHVPGQTCLKRLNYQLSDIFQFESEFNYARTVAISCGTNDLARFGKTARTLADTVCPDLVRCCRQYIRTNFIFTSLTLTRDKSWLNAEVLRFNHIMQDLARDIPNLYYYDSHGLICREVDPDRVWDRHDRNGIRRLVTRGLVNCVGKLTGSHLPHHRNCEWLYYVHTNR